MDEEDKSKRSVFQRFKDKELNKTNKAAIEIYKELSSQPDSPLNRSEGSSVR